MSKLSEIIPELNTEPMKPSRNTRVHLQASLALVAQDSNSNIEEIPWQAWEEIQKKGKEKIPIDEEEQLDMDELKRCKLQSNHARKLCKIKARIVIHIYEAFTRAQHSGKTLGDIAVVMHKDIFTESISTYSDIFQHPTAAQL